MAKSRQNNTIPSTRPLSASDPEIIAPIVAVAVPAPLATRKRQPPINSVRCEICGKPARAYSTKPNVTYYRCDGVIDPPGCGHTFVKQRRK